ncbi:MAG TPA: hypothetical protein VF883_25285 [Thermoanaerobaculia bacterium]
MSQIARKSLLFSSLLVAVLVMVTAGTALWAARPGKVAATSTSGTCPPPPTTTNPFPAPPAPVLSRVIPTVIPPHPASQSPLQSRAFFDTFSWQSFIALNWPAAIDSATQLPIRGLADPSSGVSIGSPGTRVWETYKADWETFRGGAVPTPWPSYDVSGPAGPCSGSTKNAASGAGRVLTMPTKMDDVVQGFNEAFAGPLIAQYPAGTPAQSQYARYEIRLNQSQYTQILQNGWYLTKNLPVAPNVVNFDSTPTAAGSPGSPYGAIEIKAAWKEIVNQAEAPSYYTITASVVEPGTPATCRQNVLLGLVGLHIAHKITPFREWVWSTFEHIANVPDPHYPNIKSYSFNNGTNDPPPNPKGYDYEPPIASSAQPLPGGKPVQVNRVTPIPATPQFATQSINDAFQGILPAPWNNYQLVATQWPTVTDAAQFVPSGSYPYNCDCPFPNDPVANAVAETYFQSASPGINSCMHCHYLTAATDFSWTLAKGSYPQPGGARAAAATGREARNLVRLQQLRTALRAATERRNSKKP